MHCWSVSAVVAKHRVRLDKRSFRSRATPISVTRLAAFAANCEIFEIKLSRGYSESHFREDLKILYNKLGLENKKIVFMFGDQHVAEDGTSSSSFEDSALDALTDRFLGIDQ